MHCAETVSDTVSCQDVPSGHGPVGHPGERRPEHARRARRTARRPPRRPGGQVDLAPRGPARGDLRRRDACHGVWPLRGHGGDDRRGARARGRDRGGGGGHAARARNGRRGAHRPGRADRLRQRRHARPVALRDPRRAARILHAHGRRIALASPDGADCRAARADGGTGRDDRRPPPTHDRWRVTRAPSTTPCRSRAPR